VPRLDSLVLNDTSYTAKVSGQVNRKLPAKNPTVQLLTLYTDPEPHNAQRYGIRMEVQSDGGTDRRH